MNSCSLSAGGQRWSASAWSISSGVRTLRHVAQRRLAPQLLDALGRERVADARRPAVLGRRCREFAQAETWFVTPFSETAARNRSVVPTSQLTMNPP